MEIKLFYQQLYFITINQPNFYSANIPGVARLSGATSKSVLNNKIDEAVPQRQQVIGHAGVYGAGRRPGQQDMS